MQPGDTLEAKVQVIRRKDNQRLLQVGMEGTMHSTDGVVQEKSYIWQIE